MAAVGARKRMPSGARVRSSAGAQARYRDTDDVNCCPCDTPPTTQYYPLLYCPEGTEETGQAIALTPEQAPDYVGKVLRVISPDGAGFICVIVGPLPDPPLDPDDYTFPTYTGPYDDCDLCCPPENYMQAYDCATLIATGKWVAIGNLQPHSVMFYGGGDTGLDPACYFFADCEAEVPPGDEELNLDGFREWVARCSNCECLKDFWDLPPDSLTITVSQPSIDCCQAIDGTPNARYRTRGSAAGTFTVPLDPVTREGTITVTGVQRKIVVDDPTPFAMDCSTGFQSVDPDCCDDGRTTYFSDEFDVIVYHHFTGVVLVRAQTADGCLLWEFQAPVCTDNFDGEDGTLSRTDTFHFFGGHADCSQDSSGCPSTPDATAAMVTTWAP